MTQGGTVKCQEYSGDISKENYFSSEGRTLCEDCYIEAGQRISVRDPLGRTVQEILQGEPRANRNRRLDRSSNAYIYEFVKIKEKVTREDLAKEFRLKPGELENEFAMLRHCQLLKGKRECNKIYLILW